MMRALILTIALLAMPVWAADLPDAALTPGVWRKDLTLDQICHTKWGHDERLVTEAMKKQVMAAYHMTPASCPSGEIEIDHLISRELGGADDVKNLWPQCYENPVPDPEKPGSFLAPSIVPEWGAHKKDRLENDLGKRICLPGGNKDSLGLQQARSIETTNWIVAYIERYGDPRAKAPAP